MAIIDFTYPNLVGQKWTVIVTKIKNDTSYIIKDMFDIKEDAFAYYEKIRNIWRQEQNVKNR